MTGQITPLTPLHHIQGREWTRSCRLTFPSEMRASPSSAALSLIFPAVPRPHSSQRISDVLGLAKLKILGDTLQKGHGASSRGPKPAAVLKAMQQWRQVCGGEGGGGSAAEGPRRLLQGAQAGSCAQGYAAVATGMWGGGRGG